MPFHPYKRLAVTLAGVLGVVVVGGCDAPETAVVAQPNAPRAAGPALATAPAEPTPEPDAVDVPAVRITSRPDPFRSFLWEVDEPVAAGTSPLERFGLDQLKLVAVVTRVATPYAMVEDPTGQGHLVRVGMLMGKDQAQVRSIGRDGLVLEQWLRHPDGTVARIMVPVRLDG